MALSAVAPAAAATCALASALPWVTLDRHRASGFELARIARHFGRTTPLTDALVDIWFAVPVGAGLAVACALLGWRRSAAVLAIAIALVAGAAAAVTFRATRGEVRYGVWATVGASLAAVTGAVLSLAKPPIRPMHAGTADSAR